jgi:hypothetical protein
MFRLVLIVAACVALVGCHKDTVSSESSGAFAAQVAATAEASEEANLAEVAQQQATIYHPASDGKAHEQLREEADILGLNSTGKTIPQLEAMITQAEVKSVQDNKPMLCHGFTETGCKVSISMLLDQAQASGHCLTTVDPQGCELAAVR